MSARDDVSSYTMACVQDKLQPAQISAITNRSTLVAKQLVTVIANISTIFYCVFHIHSYHTKDSMDTALGIMLTCIWITCFLFEFIYSLDGEVHFHFEHYKSLIISVLCVTLICVYSGELTAISIVIFMCIELAITCVKCIFGGLNPNSLTNLISKAGLELQSVPGSALSTAGYFSGMQLIQRDFIEFYKDINLVLFSTVRSAQKYPKDTHVKIYHDLVNVYNLALDSHHNTANKQVCCFNRNQDRNKKQSYSLLPTKD